MRFNGGLALIALLMLFLLGGLVFRNLVIETAPPAGSRLLERLVPGSQALLPRGASITPEERAAFRAQLTAVARHAPLTSAPLRETAQLDEAAERYDDALNKLLVARALDPRDQIVRLHLVGQFLRHGRAGNAIEEAEAAMRLDSRLVPQLAPLLPGIANLPGGEAALRRSIAGNPGWRRYLIQDGRFTAEAPGLVFALVSQAGIRDPAEQRLAEQSRFLWRLINLGDYDTALLAFVNLLPPEAVSRSQPVYDSEFEAMPGPPPFNWGFSPGRVDKAVIRKDGGGGGVLRVEFYDDRKAQLAQQLLLLPPGRYALHTIASTASGLANGTLAWQVACHKISKRGSPGVLARLALDDLTNTSGGRSTAFEVPDNDCAAQLLTLAATPSATPAARRATINSVKVERQQ